MTDKTFTIGTEKVETELFDVSKKLKAQRKILYGIIDKRFKIISADWNNLSTKKNLAERLLLENIHSDTIMDFIYAVRVASKNLDDLNQKINEFATHIDQERIIEKGLATRVELCKKTLECIKGWEIT